MTNLIKITPVTGRPDNLNHEEQTNKEKSGKKPHQKTKVLRNLIKHTHYIKLKGRNDDFVKQIMHEEDRLSVDA